MSLCPTTPKPSDQGFDEHVERPIRLTPVDLSRDTRGRVWPRTRTTGESTGQRFHLSTGGVVRTIATPGGRTTSAAGQGTECDGSAAPGQRHRRGHPPAMSDLLSPPVAAEWPVDQPARVVDLRPPGALLELSRWYRGFGLRIVDEVLGQAYALGAQTAVIECHQPDELDADTGDGTGQTERDRLPCLLPTLGHRVHFFLEAPTVALDHDTALCDFGDLTYLGYTVLQPFSDVRVGQTLLCPPPELDADVSCQAEATVDLFGYELRLRTAPFTGTDPDGAEHAQATVRMAAQLHSLAYRHGLTSLTEATDTVREQLAQSRSIRGDCRHQPGCGASGLGLRLQRTSGAGVGGQHRLSLSRLRYARAGHQSPNSTLDVGRVSLRERRPWTAHIHLP